MSHDLCSHDAQSHSLRSLTIPELSAAFDDMQAIVTVCPGIFSGNPALSKAYRETNSGYKPLLGLNYILLERCSMF